MSLLIATTVYYLAGQAVRALPIQPTVQLAPASCNDLHNCRTIWNIIWSCVVTIFTCTWVAIHPNIPGRGENPLRVSLRHMKCMGLALIAPEVVIVWAMRQSTVAYRLQKKYKDRGWTQAHGFFVLMGGFVLFDGKEPLYTLIPEELESDLFPFPEVTGDEIKDRSKGNVLSKGLVVVQTGWFVLQCAARAVEHLPVTNLELLTLAFAVLNFATYGLWWNKPLHVRCPVPVYKRQSSDGGQTDKEGRRGDKDGGQKAEGSGQKDEGAGKGGRNDGQEDGDDEGGSRPAVRHAGHSMINIILMVLAAVVTTMKTVGAFILFPFLVPMDPLMEMGLHGDVAEPERSRVPEFYSGKLKDGDGLYVWSATVLIATIFGAIHCIGWSFQLASHTEQFLWRLSSIAITCIPIFITIVTTMVGYLGLVKGSLMFWTGILVAIVAGAAYVLARVVLLVLVLMSLKSLPPGAYQTVHWTTFIPHI